MRAIFLASVVAAGAALTASHAAAHAEGPIKVAVVPGIAVNVDAARVDALGQDLAEALAEELLVSAVGGLEVRRRLPVEGLPPDCVAKRECIVDVARRLDVTQLLFIVVVDTGAGGAVQIDSTWIDPAAAGASASRPAIDVAPGSDPKPRFLAAARSLLPGAPVRPKKVSRMTEAVPRHYTGLAIATTVVSLAGIGVGVGFGLDARSRYKKCDVQPMAPVGCDDEHRGIRNRALIADIGYAVGIAGAVATIVLIATSGKESRLVVEPSSEGVALTAVGRF